MEIIVGKQQPRRSCRATPHRTDSMRRFILRRVVARQEHPLVLFVDDLQWSILQRSSSSSDWPPRRSRSISCSSRPIETTI